MTERAVELSQRVSAELAIRRVLHARVNGNTTARREDTDCP